MDGERAGARTSTPRRWVARRPLWTFFGLAFAVSWALWTPLLFERSTPDATTGPLWWLFYLGGLGPAGAALVTTALVDGRPGVSDLLRRVTGRRAGLGWITLGWIALGALLPVLLLALIVPVVALGTGEGLSPEDLGRTAKLPGVGLLGIVVVEVLFFGFGEETGWRGFAWPRLRRRHGLLVAAAIVTVPWALWHLPAFVFNSGMSGLGVGGTIGWVASLFTGSVILGWLTDRAAGSVLPAILFHGVLDVVFVSRAVAGRYDAYLGAAVVLLAVALLAAEAVRVRRRVPSRG